VSDNIEGKRLRWSQAARRHHIGKASARHVMNTTEAARTTTTGGAHAWLWVGLDKRGRELEIIAVEIEPADEESYLLVIHVMPTQLRG
jgi:hypothetical protein